MYLGVPHSDCDQGRNVGKGKGEARTHKQLGRRAKRLRKSKVRDFDHGGVVLAEEYIFGFEIAMCNLSPMHVLRMGQPWAARYEGYTLTARAWQIW